MAQVYTFTDSNGEVRLAAEINPAPGGSQPLVGCSYILANIPVVTNDLVPWDVRLYDTDEFIPTANLFPSSSTVITTPEGKDGLYLLGLIIYSDTGPAGGRVANVEADASLGAVIQEPSGSCDIDLYPNVLSYDVGTVAPLKGQGAFVRPLRAGDEISAFVGGAALSIYNGTAGSTITVTRIADLPDVDWTQYP